MSPSLMDPESGYGGCYPPFLCQLDAFHSSVAKERSGGRERSECSLGQAEKQCKEFDLSPVQQVVLGSAVPELNCMGGENRLNSRPAALVVTR